VTYRNDIRSDQWHFKFCLAQITTWS
jgi:hypothetical protein